MNTEAIIEKLQQIQDEQILNTPLEDLNLPIRVYRGLWRCRVRTVGDVAQTWSHILNVRNIGEKSCGEILGALQAWSRSVPNFPNLDDAEGQAKMPGCSPDRRTPIEALHLSQRTYRALKRNRIDTVGDIYREWGKIASLRNVGRGTLAEIQKALPALRASGSAEAFANPDGIAQSQPARNDLADRSAADGYGIVRDAPTKPNIITASGAVVSADLLQAEEPWKSREERWKNISPRPQDYAPKNTFQIIGDGQNKIADPIRRPKKILDGSLPTSSEWFELSLYLLEKARTSRQVRTINCPICMVLTLSIKFKKHLADVHPQAFQELQKAPKGSPGRPKEKSVGTAHTDRLPESPIVKCPLCEHEDQHNVLQAHIQDSHPAIDSKLMMNRIDRVRRCRDDENLPRYQDELNALVRQYKWLTRGQEESRDGST